MFESETLKKNLMETAQDFFYTPFKSNYEGKSPRFEFLANLAMFLVTNFLGKFGDISSHFIIFARMKIHLESFLFHHCQPMRRVVNGACYSRKGPGRRLECILLCAVVGNGSRVVVTHQIFNQLVVPGCLTCIKSREITSSDKNLRNKHCIHCFEIFHA